MNTYSSKELIAAVSDAYERTLELVGDLSDEQLLGPCLPTVNPLLWEIGHVAWFQEKWALRHTAGHAPLRPEADSLYDSATIAHDTRWDLPLYSRVETLAYLRDVRDGIVSRLRQTEPTKDDAYFILLGVFHEDMHTEAFTYTRQRHAYTAPRLGCVSHPADACGEEPEEESAPLPGGDAYFPGGDFSLGADPGDPFVFDNEKWGHVVRLEPFWIAKVPVTQSEYADFVLSGGYECQELWSAEGWAWRSSGDVRSPLYWRQEGGGWARRDFDRWVPLEPRRPMLHVNWHEASAYCRWARRRLPTEAEWELAASWDAKAGRKRRYPWGDEPPSPERANLDWRSMGCLDVEALPAGDSALGCRQMIGNGWEWTQTEFAPYPGFVVDPYKEYSEPWFHDHKVLRGGSWTTRSRLIRNTWRNFYKPDRCDVWAGFRTCAQ
jgi:iron(II)-dependent oxidoreductase